MSNISLGDKVKDNVSGIVGIAVWKTECLNGCVQWGIQPQYKGTGDVLTFNIDEQTIVKVSDGLNVKRVKAKKKPQRKKIKFRQRGGTTTIVKNSGVSCGERG